MFKIIEQSFPNELRHCTVSQLLKVIDDVLKSTESQTVDVDKLKQIVTEKNIDGLTLEKMSNEEIAELMNITNQRHVGWYISSPIQSFFNQILVPLNPNDKYNENINSRYLLEIEKEMYSIKTFTIIDTNNDSNNLQLTTRLPPLQLMEYLSNILTDIFPKQIIEVIISFCPYNESMIGVSFTTNFLKKDKLTEISQYLSKMDNRLKDIRSAPGGSWGSKQYGKVHDIIDPSLFVKQVSDDKFQWIPSIIKVIDDKKCRVKVISSINRYKRLNEDEKDDNNKLFDIFELVIGRMLPYFQDVTQKKLIKNGKKLQIICKALEYKLKKHEVYGTHWHFDGIQDIEHVCSVGILYTKNELEESGNLEFSMDPNKIDNVDGWYLNEKPKEETKGNGKHFGITSKIGNCIVWNNKYLQHRLGFISNGSLDSYHKANENDPDKTRQAIICMLVDPDKKIKTENESDFIVLNEAKERRKKVKNERKGNKIRNVPYCGDCGAYGHWHNGPGGTPAEPVLVKLV